MAICELVHTAALQAPGGKACPVELAIDERHWSEEDARRLVSIERELARRWIQEAALAQARGRESADGGARDVSL